MRFTFLTGDRNWKQYGGKFVSKKLSNGEFDYWLVLEVTNMHDATGELDQSKYNVSLQALSPQQAGLENVRAAYECCGIVDDADTNPLVPVLALSDYGIYAALWNESGNNLNVLLHEAHKQAELQGDMLFGFAMDRYENRIGQTGWDLIRGQDIREFLGVIA